ncbi:MULTISPECIES: pheST operon leader peptide PheM [Providencia]|uniref:pheST attenuator peptide n=2 Tax=Providencia TaxID=586 RepID=A0A9Q8I0X4_PRORE|nr:pheST operon leader peptide PheM [Providencia rettgeri]ELR5072576.1 pheST operon leader peptide PheM [Providencia stuartii]MBN6359755.1 pheST operon leader peptide PheM [Providencia huaxiensis]MRF66358.1 pheST operon leader peptide PheM [Escherichia coli]QIF68042.1 pheST operon leader peptide PheM [Providencia sp. 1709051003]THB27051.1 pheST operon leader peptide PheM [Providencia sp. MGF014]
MHSVIFRFFFYFST